MDVEPASWPMERCSSTSCSGRTQRIVKPDTMQCDLLNKCIGSDPRPCSTAVHVAEAVWDIPLAGVLGEYSPCGGSRRCSALGQRDSALEHRCTWLRSRPLRAHIIGIRTRCSPETFHGLNGDQQERNSLVDHR